MKSLKGTGRLRARCSQHRLRIASEVFGAARVAVGDGAQSLVSASCVVEIVAN